MTWSIDPEDFKRCFTKYFRLLPNGIYEELENWFELEANTAEIVSANVLEFCNIMGLINWSY